MRISDWSSDVCSSDLARAVRALAALRQIADAFDRPARTVDVPAEMPRIAAGTSFNEASAKALLGKIGVASPVERVVDSPDEVADPARTMRLPPALKIVSSAILHKNDNGGVKPAITPPATPAPPAGPMA